MTTAVLTSDTAETVAVQAEETAQPAQPAQQFPTAPGAQPARDDTRGFAITSFVLGIASVVSSWTFIAPIIGLVFGVLALRRNTQERTLALWGVWLNAAMLALTALMVLGVIAVLGVGAIGGAFAGYWA